MKCPNCGQELVKRNYRGIQVDTCQACGGTWFDVAEVDQLEDLTFADDTDKKHHGDKSP